jgi:hypothetical protein
MYRPCSKTYIFLLGYHNCSCACYKDMWVNRNLNPLILSFGTGCIWIVGFTRPAALPSGNRHRQSFNVRLGGLQSPLGLFGLFPAGTDNQDPSDALVTIPTDLPRLFKCRYRWLVGPEVFQCFFLSCKANARVYLAKTGHGPHSS